MIRIQPLFLLLFFFPLIFARVDLEVGSVQWKRNYTQSLLDSKKNKKPIFALFQEVPGCSGCQKFGKEVLSNPLMVEAIEHLFIPLLIYNNQGKSDAKLLQKYKEPSWNFQVIRFWNSQGKDIIPRQDKIWTISPLAKRMIHTLKIQKSTVPEYLKSLYLSDLSSSHLKKVAFQMPCFWTGEYHLGKINGVANTQAGFIYGKEVVLVWYDPSIISLQNIIQKAIKIKCADKVFVFKKHDQKSAQQNNQLTVVVTSLKPYRIAPPSDQKKQLENSLWKKINLNSYQLTKINAWVKHNQQKALSFLSPQQREYFLNLLK